MSKKKRPLAWCDRTLVISPVYYGLSMSERDFVRRLKHLGVPREDWPPFTGADAHAATHFFEKSNQVVAVVTLGSLWKKRTRAQAVALLAHEAVHVWQEIRKQLGEIAPSSEFEAYAVQNIVQSLVEAFEEGRRA